MNQKFNIIMSVGIAMALIAAAVFTTGPTKTADAQRIDLSNLNFSDTKSFEFNNGHAGALAREVARQISVKNLPLTPPKEALLRSTGNTGGHNKWNNDGQLHKPTLDAVCNVFGYKEGIHANYLDQERSHRYPNGKGYWHSPEDNTITYFDPSRQDFVTRKAGSKFKHTWMTSITCRGKIGAEPSATPVPSTTPAPSTTPVQPTPKPSTPPHECVCTQIYAPVCGVDGKTYGNSCVAECAGVPIAHEGACKAKPTPKPTHPIHKFPFSISTSANVFQSQFAWSHHPVNMQQQGNINLWGPSPVNVSGAQHISGSGQLGQQQALNANMFWQAPFSSWHSFNW